LAGHQKVHLDHQVAGEFLAGEREQRRRCRECRWPVSDLLMLKRER
jgi:hypothetical protein